MFPSLRWKDKDIKQIMLMYVMFLWPLEKKQQKTQRSHIESINLYTFIDIMYLEWCDKHRLDIHFPFLLRFVLHQVFKYSIFKDLSLSQLKAPLCSLASC